MNKDTEIIVSLLTRLISHVERNKFRSKKCELIDIMEEWSDEFFDPNKTYENFKDLYNENEYVDKIQEAILNFVCNKYKITD